MGGTARSAKSLIRPANEVPAKPVPANTGPANPVMAGTYAREVGPEVITGWHFHDRHQLEYAFEGVAEVETATSRYLLPPQQAVWIPAGVEHSSTLTNVKAISVFFDPAMDMPAGDRVRVLAAPPVMREMMFYARRWPLGRPTSDRVADKFFAALAELVAEWLDDETPLSVPTSADPLVAAAMRFTQRHLDDITLAKVCAEVGASERTLRRAFVADTGMSWRKYLQESRVLRAMALLAGKEHNLLEIAQAVGFDSASAFSRAFGQYTGESPLHYRRRIASSPAPPFMDDGFGVVADEAARACSHFDKAV